jgi:hypothetical protein
MESVNKLLTQPAESGPLPGRYSYLPVTQRTPKIAAYEGRGSELNRAASPSRLQSTWALDEQVAVEFMPPSSGKPVSVRCFVRNRETTRSLTTLDWLCRHTGKSGIFIWQRVIAITERFPRPQAHLCVVSVIGAFARYEAAISKFV